MDVNTAFNSALLEVRTQISNDFKLAQLAGNILSADLANAKLEALKDLLVTFHKKLQEPEEIETAVI